MPAILVRLPEDEKAMIERLAKSRYRSVSAEVRRLIVREAIALSDQAEGVDDRKKAASPQVAA